MKKDRFILGWFNAWVGLIWIFLFIHSVKFFFAYESFLQRSFTPIEISTVSFEYKRDSTKLKIITDNGTFLHYNVDNFKIITDSLTANKTIEVWYDKDNKNTADFRVNGEFILGSSIVEIVAYLIGLIVSGAMVVISIILIIKTKGWGTYDLMEKHGKEKT